MGFESIQHETLRNVAKNHYEDFKGIEPVISEDSLSRLCEGDPTLQKLMNAMMDYAVRYAVDVWDMQQFIHAGKFETEEGAQEFKEMDDARTRLHTTLVESIAIFSRALGKAGKDNEWVRELMSGTTLGRAQCGAFALMLVYQRYLETTS